MCENGIDTRGDCLQSSGAGSAIALVPGSADELYGLTDRGPNVEGRTKNEKVLPVPDFQPRIEKFRLRDGTASVERTILLTGPNGAPISGLVDPAAPTGEPWSAWTVHRYPRPIMGSTPKGLVALTDGTFWVSDEYRPFIVHFDVNGKEPERLSSFNGTLPRELSLRGANRGLEGLTITPDGSTLVGMMQSALSTPGPQGSGKAVPLTRIVTVNLATKPVREYLYPLADPEKTKSWFRKSRRSPTRRFWWTNATENWSPARTRRSTSPTSPARRMSAPARPSRIAPTVPMPAVCRWAASPSKR